MLFRRQGPLLFVDTPAKLNLFLEVLGKRADGYHEIETVMVSVGLYDSLRFEEEASSEISFDCSVMGCGSARDSAASLPPGENLVVRAARLLQEYAGTSRGARISLLKRIPVSSGLGGGSSDAAATLAGLNRLWDLRLKEEELHNLAARLGSDVNFFLPSSRAAICRGRGEKVEPLSPGVSLNFVIVRPERGLSTKAVFEHGEAAQEPRKAADLIRCLKLGRLGKAAQHLHNALQPPAERLNEEVQRLRAKFSEQPVLGHVMSGSGSAYLGLCRHRRQALCVASRMRSARMGRVYVAQCRP